MRLSTTHLFEAGGIDCWHIRENSSGVIERLRARAVFVIEETVAACRDAQLSGKPEGVTHEVSFGDILMSWWDADGVLHGRRCSAGQDAGLAIPVPGDEKFMLPFTGENMFDAWVRLSRLDVAGTDLSVHHRRVLFSVEGLFRMIQGYPDIERFSESIIGSAYRAAFVNHRHGAIVDLSDAQFARICMEKTLRARIGGMDPGHADAIAAHLPHEDALSELGVAQPRSISRSGSRNGPATIERALRDVLSHVMTSRLDGLPVTVLKGEDFDFFMEKISPHMLSGSWVDAIQDEVQDVWLADDRGDTEPAAAPDTFIASFRGRDLMVIDPDDGSGLVVSWPSAERRSIMSSRGRHIISVSPEEIPERSEIDRLYQVLSSLQGRSFVERPPENE